jgi:nucleotide-binding universal stress UspA family protein
VVPGGLPTTLVHSELARDCWAELWETDRRDALRAATERAGTLHVPATVHATVGDPGAALCGDAADSDLLVIGSRRWGITARVVSGAAGERLAPDCACSLLIVPDSRSRDTRAVAAHPPTAPRPR